jgi:hypothetical protein
MMSFIHQIRENRTAHLGPSLRQGPCNRLETRADRAGDADRPQLEVREGCSLGDRAEGR